MEMSAKTFEEEVSLEIQELKDSIAGLKEVENKIDEMNSLISDVKNSMSSTFEHVKRQEKILDTISTNANFSKNANTVRELKNQICELEGEIDGKTASLLDRIITTIDAMELSQKEEASKLVNFFTEEVGGLKKRVLANERWRILVIVGLIVHFALIIFIP